MDHYWHPAHGGTDSVMVNGDVWVYVLGLRLPFYEAIPSQYDAMDVSEIQLVPAER
jgi:hypothetical protein